MTSERGGGADSRFVRASRVAQTSVFEVCGLSTMNQEKQASANRLSKVRDFSRPHAQKPQQGSHGMTFMPWARESGVAQSLRFPNSAALP
jgi:hypothetical protein